MQAPRPRGPSRPPAPPSQSAGQTLDELERGESYENLILNRVDLAGAEASMVHLHRVAIGGGSLASSRLSTFSLRDATLTSCDMAGVFWESAGLARVVLNGCRMTGAQMPGARWEDVLVEEGSLQMAAFTRGRFSGVLLDGCNLQGAHFEQMDLRGVIFRNCDLREALFERCQMQGADVRGCKVDRMRLHPDQLRGLILDGEQAATLVASWGALIVPFGAEID